MISSTILTLVVIPAIYSLWKEREVRQASRVSITPVLAPQGGSVLASAPADHEGLGGLTS
jgi:hypothetical protein